LSAWVLFGAMGFGFVELRVYTSFGAATELYVRMIRIGYRRILPKTA